VPVRPSGEEGNPCSLTSCRLHAPYASEAHYWVWKVGKLAVSAHLLVFKDILLYDRDGRKDLDVMQPSALELFLAEVISLLDEADSADTVLSQ